MRIQLDKKLLEKDGRKKRNRSRRKIKKDKYQRNRKEGRKRRTNIRETEEKEGKGQIEKQEQKEAKEGQISESRGRESSVSSPAVEQVVNWTLAGVVGGLECFASRLLKEGERGGREISGKGIRKGKNDKKRRKKRMEKRERKV